MTIKSIKEWFERARPVPTQQDASVQLGVHFEEIAEMADALLLVPQSINESFENDLVAFISLTSKISAQLKQNTSGISFKDLNSEVRILLLDSLLDQIVTAVGTAHTQQMDVVGGLKEVDASNWSKFDEQGQPIFDENKKVTKGPNYRKAALDQFI